MGALSGAGGATADVDAVEEIMRRGGCELRARMARTEAHLEALTAQAGTPLAKSANATISAGGKRLRPLLGRFAGDSDAYTYLPNSVKR
ncbi:MAG: hypothetical protein ACTHM1_01445, partial [Solirubrobacteraceae bacterium]